eukprot:147447_1
MAHKATENEQVVKEWTEDELVQYIQYLYRKGNLKRKAKMDDIIDIVEEKPIDGDAFWAIKNAKELRKILGDDLSDESRAIYTHLRKLKKKNAKELAPCEFQLEYVPIVDWDTETLQRFIASIDPNGKYFEYMSKFEGISGDMLLHKIKEQSSKVLSEEPFCIDDDEDRLIIWRKIQAISTQNNTQTPDVSDVVEQFKSLKSKLNKDTAPESARGSYHDDDDEIDDTKEKPLDIDSFKDKDPSKWSICEVVAWLCDLEGGKYAKYKPIFIQFESDGECFEYFNDTLLIQYGIKSVAHRRNIVNAAHGLLCEDLGLKSLNANSHIAIKNGLIICIVIGQYEAKRDVTDVANDVAYYRNVLSAKYNYKLMSSVDMKLNPGYTMTEEHVKAYVTKQCIPELLGDSNDPDAEPKYDALLVALSGHGTIDSIICSDSKKITYSNVRKWFQSHDALKKIPRFFCVDACRVRDDKEEQINDKEEKKYADDGSGSIDRNGGTGPIGLTATIMGNAEGLTVKGGKVAKYLCTEWDEEYEKNAFNPCALKPFGTLFTSAVVRIQNDTKNDKQRQKLMINEYDRLIDNVVFVPSTISRGGNPHDGTTPIIDDDLRNVLNPQAGGSTTDLMGYYFQFYDAGIIDNAALSALTENRLNELVVDIKPFHRRELLRRVQALNN